MFNNFARYSAAVVIYQGPSKGFVGHARAVIKKGGKILAVNET